MTTTTAPVEALTVDSIEQIILNTEPAELSDRGDRIWTRRMAVALHAALTASPAQDEKRDDIPKLTRAELAALFGPTMPMEVAMFVSCSERPLIEVRKEVYRHALAPQPAPVTATDDIGRLVERLLYTAAIRERNFDDDVIAKENRDAATLLLSLASERASVTHQRDGYRHHLSLAEQIAGKALGYPWYKDDQKNFPGATEADGVCIGEHVGDTIVAELATAYSNLALERDGLREALKPFADEAASFDPPEGDDDYPPYGDLDLTIGDLRRARTALTPKEKA